MGSKKRVFPDDPSSGLVVFRISFSEPVINLREVWELLEVSGANYTRYSLVAATAGSCDLACADYRLLLQVRYKPLQTRPRKCCRSQDPP